MHLLQRGKLHSGLLRQGVSEYRTHLRVHKRTRHAVFIQSVEMVWTNGAIFQFSGVQAKSVKAQFQLLSFCLRCGTGCIDGQANAWRPTTWCVDGIAANIRIARGGLSNKTLRTSSSTPSNLTGPASSSRSMKFVSNEGTGTFVCSCGRYCAFDGNVASHGFK